MAELDDERQCLIGELDELTRKIDSRLYRRPSWRIVFFRFEIPIPLGSTGISWLYMLLNLGVFVFGIAAIFIGDSWKELGIALIVGAMFAIGSFVAQILSAQPNSEQHVADLAWRDDDTREVRALILHARTTHRRLDELTDQDPDM